MHFLKHKEAKPKPFITTTEIFAVPGHRRVRNKRYNAKGEFIGYSKPRPVIDTTDVANVKKALAEAKGKPMPAEAKPFDLSTFRPLPGRLLLKRPPPITHVGGIELAPADQKSQPYFDVVMIGAGVTVCRPGDKVVIKKSHNPKPVRLGHGNNFHIGLASNVVAIWGEIPN